MKLSVAMLTYNHDKYIAQALDSILMQQVDFDYEIVIGDDLSQDRTREILVDYQAKHPDKIRLLLYETKQGVGGNVYQVLNTCCGEYVAFLEGDDYWTSENKLQTQVNFLDTNPEYAVSFHSVRVYSQEEGIFVVTDGIGISNCKHTLLDILKRDIFPRTCSIVYRRDKFDCPQWVREVTYVEYAFYVIVAHAGYFGFCDQTMSVYRRHQQGVWSGAGTLRATLNEVDMLEHLNSYYEYRYARYLLLRRKYAIIAREYSLRGDRKQSQQYVHKALFSRNSGTLSAKDLIAMITIVYCLPLYKLYKFVRYKILAGLRNQPATSANARGHG
jgi:glycosyltransferase involved in cell wall biosynthesis